jgi:hypothetical protein
MAANDRTKRECAHSDFSTWPERVILGSDAPAEDLAACPAILCRIQDAWFGLVASRVGLVLPGGIC